MKKLEKKFQTEFWQWAKKNRPFNTSVPIEYKAVPGNTFNVKAWIKSEPQQPRSLMDAKTPEGTYHKISDMSLGRKPFDATFYCNCENAYVIIYFNGCEKFAILDIDYVIRFRDKSVNTKKILEDGHNLFTL